MANKKKTKPEKKIINATEKAVEEVLAEVAEEVVDEEAIAEVIDADVIDEAEAEKEQMIFDVKSGKVYVDVYEDTYKEPFPG